MTPAANPRKTRWVTARSLRKKNTTAEPAVVMNQVKPQPIAAHMRDCIRLASICIRFRLPFVRFPISGQNTLIVRRPCSPPPTKPLDSFERLRDVLDGCPHADHAPEAHPCATCGFIKPTTIHVFDHVATKPLDSFERLRDVLDGCPHADHAPEAHPCATCGFIKPTTIHVFDHVAVRRTINPF